MRARDRDLRLCQRRDLIALAVAVTLAAALPFISQDFNDLFMLHAPLSASNRGCGRVHVRAKADAQGSGARAAERRVTVFAITLLVGCE